MSWSALKALQRPTAETYKKNRVFFPDERTALAAGYRPCSKCMKAHYDMWKAGTLEGSLPTPHDGKLDKKLSDHSWVSVTI